MSANTILNPHDPEFERFLYAPVGEDQVGHPVSMLSVLARLKLDPWEEAADLAALTRDAAEQRLDKLLARCLDVPALGQDHHAVAQALAPLLPERRAGRDQPDQVTCKGRSISWGMLLTILVLGLVLARVVFTGEPGSVE